MKQRLCKHCVHWSERAECRVFPPQVVSVVRGGGMLGIPGVTGTELRTVWPKTSADDWCAQHEPEEG